LYPNYRSQSVVFSQRERLVTGTIQECDLSVLAFAGAANWPVWAGVERGFFATRGLRLKHQIVPNSRVMARELYEGTAQIALTSVDNVVAYAAGQGEEDLPERPDFFAFMGVDDGLLSLVVRPGIGRVTDLRGRRIAVDAPTTGFAFVLREMLDRSGLKPGDFELVSVGNGAQRLQALLAGEVSATLLNTPLDLMAVEAGMVPLVPARTELGAYQGIVGAARRSWAAEHRGQLAGFIEAFADSLQWLADNQGPAIRILREHFLGLGESAALATYLQLFSSAGGFQRDLRIQAPGLATVLSLRARYADSSLPLNEAGAYCDESFAASLLAQVLSAPAPRARG
jgi:ABC-type nitrate/sulfonate/bicarbonate transport system substrate-binding protein